MCILEYEDPDHVFIQHREEAIHFATVLAKRSTLFNKCRSISDFFSQSNRLQCKACWTKINREVDSGFWVLSFSIRELILSDLILMLSNLILMLSNLILMLSNLILMLSNLILMLSNQILMLSIQILMLTIRMLKR